MNIQSQPKLFDRWQRRCGLSLSVLQQFVVYSAGLNFFTSVCDLIHTGTTGRRTVQTLPDCFETQFIPPDAIPAEQFC